MLNFDKNDQNARLVKYQNSLKKTKSALMNAFSEYQNAEILKLIEHINYIITSNRIQFNTSTMTFDILNAKLNKILINKKNEKFENHKFNDRKVNSQNLQNQKTFNKRSISVDSTKNNHVNQNYQTKTKPQF